MFWPLCDCVCPKSDSRSCKQIWMNFFGGVVYVTSNSWLDFRADLHHDVDAGIIKRNCLPFFSIYGAIMYKICC